MRKGIISPIFNGQIREAMVVWYPSHRTAPNETYSIHPPVKTGLYSCYGPRQYQFVSNRPWLRESGQPLDVRPVYQLCFGVIDNSTHLQELIKALDEWVVNNVENFDNSASK